MNFSSKNLRFVETLKQLSNEKKLKNNLQNTFFTFINVYCIQSIMFSCKTTYDTSGNKNNNDSYNIWILPNIVYVIGRPDFLIFHPHGWFRVFEPEHVFRQLDVHQREPLERLLVLPLDVRFLVLRRRGREAHGQLERLVLFVIIDGLERRGPDKHHDHRPVLVFDRLHGKFPHFHAKRAADDPESGNVAQEFNVIYFEKKIQITYK